MELLSESVILKIIRCSSHNLSQDKNNEDGEI